MAHPGRANGRRVRGRPAIQRPALIIGCIATAVVALAVLAAMTAGPRTDAPAASVAVPRDPDGSAVGSTPLAAAPARNVSVEVPDVSGMPVLEAEVVLRAAGLAMTSTPGASRGRELSSAYVSAQDPPAGTLVRSGGMVRLMVARRERAPRGATAHGQRWTVCIDPVHQWRGDEAPEPIGPGASGSRPRMTSGATGVRTGIPEYEITLQIAMNLKERLETAGVRVVMTRTTNDVDLSNAERARVAGRTGADLYVRVDAEGHPEEAVAGVRTLYPAPTRWTRGIAGESERAARLVHARIRARTGAPDRGVQGRRDLSGFNFSRVPVVLVECGLLSNPVEDRLLASPHYQDKLATGIAEGVLTYLRGAGR